MPAAVTPSPEIRTYLESTLHLRDALLALKANVPGPGANTPEERQALMQRLNQHYLESHEAFIAFNQAGLALTSQEVATLKARTQELLHPLVLGAPFAHRAYTKPLGYAGDYIMVRQLLDEPLQGPTAYDQGVNLQLLAADFAQGHRNRIDILHRLLVEKAVEAHAQGKRLRVLSIGCGPAEETQRFLRTCPTPEVAEIDLLDFNRETLDWVAAQTEAIMAETGRRAVIRTIEKSVYDLAKRVPEEETAEYDLVICAGLFDYLTDRFCTRVVNYCVAKTVVGGTTLITNVCPAPNRFFMGTVMEWELILRGVDEVARLMPSTPQLLRDVYADDTGTNIIGTVLKVA